MSQSFWPPGLAHGVDPRLQQRLQVLQETGACCQDLPGLVARAGAVPNREEALRRFEALADENRLLIALMLRDRPGLCACEVQAALGVSHPTVSHHMRLLREAGLVLAERRGRWTHYTLTHEGAALVDTVL